MNVVRNNVIGIALCFGLLIPVHTCVGGDEDTIIESAARTGVVGLVVVLIAAGTYRIYTALKGTGEQQARLISVEGGVNKLDADLAAFKADAKKDLDALLDGEKALAEGQRELSAHVTHVKADVAGARKEIAGVHEVAVRTEAVATDVQVSVNIIKQELACAQEQLKRQTALLAHIQSTGASKCDISAVQLLLAKTDGDIESLAKIVLTRGDVADIKKDLERAVDQAVEKQFAQTRAQYEQLSGSSSYGFAKARPALSAPQATIKTVN